MKPVCVHYAPYGGVADVSDSDRARKILAFIESAKANGALPTQIPTVSDGESVLAGLLHWWAEWAALPAIDGESRIWLIYDTGLRGQQSSIHTAVCMSSGFAALLLMAQPDSWKKRSS